jgi:hypothetical protein
VFKQWNLLTVDNKPYALAVFTDGSLWLQFGTTRANLDAPSMANSMVEVTQAIADIRSAFVPCPFTKVIGAVTLTCDLAQGHAARFNHDPVFGIFWLADDA